MINNKHSTLGSQPLCHKCYDDQSESYHILLGATGGVDTVSPDFLVIDSLRSIPPKDALLPSEPS